MNTRIIIIMFPVSRVQSLEIQIVQLQKELMSMKRVLAEVEEQKKKVEARSR